MKIESRETTSIFLSSLGLSLVYGVFLYIIISIGNLNSDGNTINNIFLVFSLIIAGFVYYFLFKKKYKSKAIHATLMFMFFSTIVLVFNMHGF